MCCGILFFFTSAESDGEIIFKWWYLSGHLVYLAVGMTRAHSLFRYRRARDLVDSSICLSMGLLVSCMKPEQVEGFEIPGGMVNHTDTYEQHHTSTPVIRANHGSADTFTSSEEGSGTPEILRDQEAVDDHALTEERGSASDRNETEENKGNRDGKFKSIRKIMKIVSTVLSSRKIRLLRNYSPASSVTEEDPLFLDIIREADMRLTLALNEMDGAESKKATNENSVTKSNGDQTDVEPVCGRGRTFPRLSYGQNKTSQTYTNQIVNAGMPVPISGVIPAEERLLKVREGIKMFDDKRGHTTRRSSASNTN